MTRIIRVVTIFTTQELIERLQLAYPDVPVDKVIEELVKKEAMRRIIKRCTHCDKEIQLIVPETAFPLRAEWFEHARNPQCSRCNPRSKWQRVEDAE